MAKHKRHSAPMTWLDREIEQAKLTCEAELAASPFDRLIAELEDMLRLPPATLGRLKANRGMPA